MDEETWIPDDTGVQQRPGESVHGIPSIVLRNAENLWPVLRGGRDEVARPDSQADGLFDHAVPAAF